ncbi:MAG TPA: SDR family NAD(P)-dependent oxidoreductase [Vicinamibacteria bacterium]|nr:SDR family NAD(P)-dependent oxidoreductase [Vicinamibacteria bacterium]
MNCFVMGASGGLGRALCHRLAVGGHELVIASSDARDLNALASDLRLRWGASVKTLEWDASREGASKAMEGLEDPDGLFFPIGVVDTDDRGTLDPARAEELVRANFLSIVEVVSRSLSAMRAGRGGVIVGFGSIASARGRGANVVYAAAKRALESYFESLRHACAGSGVFVQLYVLGYLDTTQASGRTKLFPKASPERLAERVVRHLDRDVGVVYYPGYWRWVRLTLRATPWTLYRRISF